MKKLSIIILLAALSGCYTRFTKIHYATTVSDTPIESETFYMGTYYPSYPGIYGAPYYYDPYAYYPFLPGNYGYRGFAYFDGYRFYPYAYNSFRYHRHGYVYYGKHRPSFSPKKKNYAARTFGKRRTYTLPVKTSSQKPGIIRRRNKPANNSDTFTYTTSSTRSRKKLTSEKARNYRPRSIKKTTSKAQHQTRQNHPKVRRRKSSAAAKKSYTPKNSSGHSDKKKKKTQRRRRR